MPHSTQTSLDSKSHYSEQSRPMTSTAAALQAKSTGLPQVGRAVTSRDSRTDSSAQNPNAWKRTSSPIADAYADLIGNGGNIDEVVGSRKAGDRSSMGQYNNASKHRTQYYEDQFRYKDNEAGTIKERVQRESPVIAELRTNVIIKDEFTLVTDLSYHLAQRYTRPDSSIMIKVDHSACLALGGTFDPCYILTITALPSQMGPTVNKRNAALIQSFMADILSVSSDRGIVKFQPIEECNYAMNGTTMLGEMERLEKHQAEDNGVGGAVKRAVTSASRKSIPTFNKKSMPKLDTEVKAPTTNGAPIAAGVTPVERKRRSTAASPPPESVLSNVFELPATETNDRPSTAHGAYAAENGLRMNGISKEDLLGALNQIPDGRPKTFAGQSPISPPFAQDQTKKVPISPVQRRPSQHEQSSYRKSTPVEAPKKPVNIPISAKPTAERGLSSTTTPTQLMGPDSRTAPAPPKKDTYLDNVTTTNPTTSARSGTHSRPPTAVTEKYDPKIDARAAEKNRQLESIKDTAANTAKRRSTVTATPRMPPPPPVPESRSRESRGPSKRKSFLSAFRRSTAA
ncbi:hypothetical protein LTR36_003555 [Oleoguttula mirabilis]|uniref:L-dopachrome isomerase n=1 Tax=Oleoguttula mirabilis TaxID=1507867 RepID=A0AAV9JKF4_9PEZI|nr:hypothetical protein LTR36_003555 [Oleoguttula mirabilis]